jgi:hypothetical protein
MTHCRSLRTCTLFSCSLCWWMHPSSLSGIAAAPFLGHAFPGSGQQEGQDSVVWAMGDTNSGVGKYVSFQLRKDGSASLKTQGIGEVATDTSVAEKVLGRWTHWCATLHSNVGVTNSGMIGLYMNGISAPGVSSPVAAPLAAWLYSMSPSEQTCWFGGFGPNVAIIADHHTTTGTQTAFHGRIDEVRIWTRALSLAEINTSYNSNQWVATNLEAYFPFSDEGGTSCYDHSPATKHKLWDNCIVDGVNRRESGWAVPNCVSHQRQTSYCQRTDTSDQFTGC